MEFIFKEVRLTDDSRVHDIQIIANGKSLTNGKSICIFSCTSKRDALSFLHGLEKLVKKHTLETLKEV